MRAVSARSFDVADTNISSDLRISQGCNILDGSSQQKVDLLCNPDSASCTLHVQEQ